MIDIAVFQFNPFGVNTYVVTDPATKECAIIDPGMMSTAEENALTAYIAKNDLKVKYLLNTHMHVDHLTGDEFVERTYGVGISASAADAPLADMAAAQASHFRLRVSLPEKFHIANELHDGDTLMLGTEPFEAIAVPGHSLGSLAFYFPNSAALFSGDALFKGSIGRTDLPGGNHAQLIASIQKRLLTLPDDTTVYPGHGPATTIASERQFNPFL